MCILDIDSEKEGTIEALSEIMDNTCFKFNVVTTKPEHEGTFYTVKNTPSDEKSSLG